VWIKQGKLKTAIDYFQQQAILNPNNGAIYFNLAIAFGKIEKIDQAITNYERAVSLYANVTNSLEELARIYMFHKNVISKSVSLIQKSLEYDRNNPISWSYLLMYFFVLGDFGKSENCIRKIFELDSNHVGGKHWIQSTNQFIRFLLKMMDIACCQQLESHYNQALTEIIRGLIHQQQGETTLAMSCYQTAVDINPKLYLAHLNLGLVYESQNREDDALESWKQAIINQASY
jgi:tetratricopeptide (TPR) repeat protein